MALKINPVQYLVTTATSAAITCPANEQIVFLKANAVNVDTVPRMLTVWRVGSGGSASTTNKLLPATSMAVGTTVLPFSGQGLTGGQTLQVKATATGVMIISITYTSEVAPP
jgi:hypothetical protein